MELRTRVQLHALAMELMKRHESTSGVEEFHFRCCGRDAVAAGGGSWDDDVDGEWRRAQRLTATTTTAPQTASAERR